MELNHLRYFYEVAKAGSFSSAARLLKVSQPSLSKTVALLEDREGIKLLERSKKGVALTELGREIFSDCERIFHTVNSIELRCRSTKEVCEGYLKFGASDHIANYLLAPHLKQLQRVHPRLTPSVSVGAPNELVERLRKRELEFALFFTKVEARDMDYVPLKEFALLGVCVPELAKASAPEELTYIGSPINDYRKKPAQAVLDSLKQKTRMNFESNSQEFQKRLCLAGVGAAILVDFMVAEELRKKQLVELRGARSTRVPLYLVKRRSHFFSLAARKFLDSFNA